MPVVQVLQSQLRLRDTTCPHLGLPHTVAGLINWTPTASISSKASVPLAAIIEHNALVWDLQLIPDMQDNNALSCRKSPTSVAYFSQDDYSSVTPASSSSFWAGAHRRASSMPYPKDQPTNQPPPKGWNWEMHLQHMHRQPPSHFLLSLPLKNQRPCYPLFRARYVQVCLCCAVGRYFYSVAQTS